MIVLFSRTARAEGVDSASLLFMRLSLAAAILAFMAWRSGAQWPRRGLLPVALLMGALFAGNALAFIQALNVGTAATAAAVFFTYPALVVLLDAIFNRTWPDARSTACVSLAVLGCWLTVMPAQGMSWGGPGVWLASISACCYAVYVRLARRLADSSAPLAQSSLITASGAVCMSALVAAHGLHTPASIQGWGCVLALALVSTVLAITAFLAGVRLLGTTRASALSAAEPVVTALVAWLAFGEVLGPVSWLGMALVVAAVVLAA